MDVYCTWCTTNIWAWHVKWVLLGKCFPNQMLGWLVYEIRASIYIYSFFQPCVFRQLWLIRGNQDSFKSLTYRKTINCPGKHPTSLPWHTCSPPTLGSTLRQVERPNLSDPPLCLVSTHKSVSSFLSYNNNVIITKYTTVAYHVISSKLFGYYMYTFSQLLIAPPQTLLLQ